MVDAARRNKRVVQVGTQSRSSPAVIEAMSCCTTERSATSWWPKCGIAHGAETSATARRARRPTVLTTTCGSGPADGALSGQPHSLRLALVVRLRHRRHGERRRARHRHRAVGAGRRHASVGRHGHGGKFYFDDDSSFPTRSTSCSIIPATASRASPAADLRAADLEYQLSQQRRQRRRVLRHQGPALPEPPRQDSTSRR